MSSQTVHLVDSTLHAKNTLKVSLLQTLRVQKMLKKQKHKKQNGNGMTPAQILQAQEILESQAAKQLAKQTVIATPGKSPFAMDARVRFEKEPRKKYPRKLNTQKFHNKYQDNKILWKNGKD